MLTSLTGPRRSLAARAGAVGVGAAGYLTFVKLWDPFAPHLLQCPLHALSGLLCPGCGATRATYALMHGQVTDALRCNLLLPFAVVLVGYCLVFGSERISPRWIRAGSVVAVVFMVARNLPAFGFLTPPPSL